MIDMGEEMPSRISFDDFSNSLSVIRWYLEIFVSCDRENRTRYFAYIVPNDIMTLITNTFRIDFGTSYSHNSLIRIVNFFHQLFVLFLYLLRVFQHSINLAFLLFCILYLFFYYFLFFFF